MKTVSLILFIVLFLAPATACLTIEAPGEPGAGGGAGGPGSAPDGALTFYRDVLPILQDKCNSCHFDNGPTFAFTSYDKVEPLAGLIAHTTEQGLMPPFPPDADCADYRGEQSKRLSPDELTVLRQWADSDRPAGDPADTPAPAATPIQQIDLGPPDLLLAPPAPYTIQNNREDQYICFRLPHGQTAPMDLVAMDVEPGNLSVVHHVIVFRQEPRDEPGEPVFDCAGVPPASEFLFGWVPGSEPTAFDAGMAMRIEPEDQLIMQVHYHTDPGAPPQSDLTKIKLHTAKQPITEYVRVIWTGAIDINIGPGQNSSHGSMCQVPDSAQPIKVIGVAPHMHEIGTTFATYLQRSNGVQECLVDIPRWDFEWQGSYMFEEPIVLGPGDTLRTDCGFFNTTGQQVGFGEGTGDEMCFNFVFIVDPAESIPQFCFWPCTLLPGICEFIIDLLDVLDILNLSRETGVPVEELLGVVPPSP